MKETSQAVIGKLMKRERFSLAEVMAEIISMAINGIFPELKMKPKDIKIEHPEIENYGDYSTNLALILAGRLKMRPMEVAEKISKVLNEYIGQHQMISFWADSKDQKDKDIEIEDILEKVDIVLPGFINLWIRKNYLITLMERVLEKKKVISGALDGKKISVEYTDPNPFKEFHLGHLYSNTIGESLARIFEASGATVHRADYYGDVGMHAAKSVWGMLKKMTEEKLTLKELEKWSIKERQQFLGQGYALGVKTYEESKEIAEKIKDINYLVYVAAQDILKNEKGWQPIINYRQYIKGKEEELAHIYPVYEAGLRWSLEYFETIYKRLATKFDGYYPESWVGEFGIKLVEQGLKQGIMEKSDGSIIFRGEKYGLHTRVFVNKLGLPTYEAKELGLAPAKYENFKYDLSVIVTGNEIKEYFQVLLTVLRLIKPNLGNKTINLSHGMVKLPAGKMSSRTGNVITFEGLLDEAKRRSLKIMTEVDVAKQEKQIVAEAVALGAIRYALLKGSPVNDVVFDFEKSISFEGESGPYLMYTYARCRSVLRRAEAIGRLRAALADLQGLPLEREELAILRTIYRFSEVVVEAARNLSPNLVGSFLFELAQKYNLFYNKHSILTPDISQQSTDNREKVKQFRLMLTEAVAVVLKQGLYLLGITTVERM